MKLEDTIVKYEANYPRLTEVKNHLVEFIIEIFKDTQHIDSITGRVKSIKSFSEKAQKQAEGKQKYSDPLIQIQDQIGVRIIVFYKLDVPIINQIVHTYFNEIEQKRHVPDDPSKFNYEAVHLILAIPDDFRDQKLEPEECPEFFELQIHTLFQHALAEAGHNLSYKPSSPIDIEQERKVAFVAAQAWGADLIFNELIQSLGSKE